MAEEQAVHLGTGGQVKLDPKVITAQGKESTRKLTIIILGIALLLLIAGYLFGWLGYNKESQAIVGLIGTTLGFLAGRGLGKDT